MNSKNTTQKRLYFSALLASSLGLCSAHCHAVALDLADNALEVSNAVEPNIFLLTDNSGSMDWEVTIAGTNQGLFYMPDTDSDSSDGRRSYIFPNGATGSEYGRIVPSEPAVIEYVNTTDLNAAVATKVDPYGVWRVRYHGYNAQYYNPEVTYTPWAGVDNRPSTFTDSNPKAALYNPYDPAAGSLDLTTNLPDYGAAIPSSTTNNTPVTITVKGYYPARYYTWTDTDKDGVVDATDEHTLVEIKPGFSQLRRAFSEASGIGRSDCGTPSGGTVTCDFTAEIQNFANWFSYYRKRDLATKAAISQAMQTEEFARIGMATINDTSDHRVAVASMNSSPATGAKKTLFDTLFGALPTDGGTPLRRNFNEVGLYFRCDGSGGGNSNDIFDGSAGCPRLPAPAGDCQQNYAILLTDGFYNGDWDDQTDHDNDNSSDFDGGSFASSAVRTLADIAMKYYETDLDGDSTNNEVPATARDQLYYRGTGTLGSSDTLHQHMASYALAYGVQGHLSAMPSDVDAPFDWGNPSADDQSKVDDLRHLAYNGRGLFMNAANPVALRESMNDIFTDIGAGAASSVAFNTQNLKSDSVVYRAFFDTTNNTGDLVALPIDAATGVVDTSTVLWSAARNLDSRASASADNRVIITYKDIGAGSAGIPFQWSSLTTTVGGQQELLNSPAPAAYPGSRSGPVGKDRLEYLRGQTQYEGSTFDAGEFRTRRDVAGKLGDLVHSAPVFVGPPPFTGRGGGTFPTVKPYSAFKSANENRRPLVYIGANDGMLHAFDAKTGSEAFAYVPNTVIQNLSELTKPDYAHHFYVDLTPSINDVYASIGGSLDWHTVLIGGLGGGGKGYYALDISDPTSFNTEASAAANVLWEFTEADDGGIGNSDLGYSYSRPVLAMSNATDASAEKNHRWVAIFGNGYNSTSADGHAVLYVLFVDGGTDGTWDAADMVKIDTGVGKATSSDGTTPNGLSGVRGVDINLDGTVDYVYAGDLQGNLYRFDISSGNTADWKTSTELLFQARYGSGYPRTTVQPITNRPIVVKHPEKTGFIVVVGTGSWMTNDDATSTDIQSIYGVWDDMSASPLVTMTADGRDLVEQSFTNQAAREDGFTVRTLSDNPVKWANNKGWFIDLDVPPAGGTGVEFPGERATRDFLLRSGLLFVNTIIPKDAKLCGATPGGFTLGFNPVTGGPHSDPVFDINANGQFDLGDNVGNAEGSENIVAGFRHDQSTPADSSFISDVLVTQRSDKTVQSTKTNTGVDANTGRFSWRELKP
jgi:type IV pilus assembly protein PilY1